MKSIFTILAFVFVSFIGFSQVNVILDIKTADYTSGKKLAGVTVDVYDGANIIKSVVTPTNGVVKITIPSGKIYKFELSKPGKVSRFFNVDSKGISAEAIQGGSSVNRDMEVNLFDEVPGVDFSHVEKNPFTELYFEGNATLSFDEAIAMKMKKKIDELLKQAAAKESENDAKYQDAMAKAKDWEKKQNYQFALDKYEEASLLKPSEEEPKVKIKEMDLLLKKVQEADLGAKQKEEDYQKLIASANALQQQKKYAEAITKYEEALKIKDEQQVKDQIKDIKGFIKKEKEDELNENKYKTAIASGDLLTKDKEFTNAKAQYLEALRLKPNDAIATKKLADLELKIKAASEVTEAEKKYLAVVNAADELLAYGKLAEAKAKYQEAVTLDGTKPYPKGKIEDINVKLAAQAGDKLKNEQFLAAMKAGDALVKTAKYAEAKAKYLEAAKIDSEKTEPAAAIAKIEKLIADQAEAEKNKKIADYNTAMKAGEDLVTANKLAEAKVKYQEAQKIDPSQTKPAENIAKIDKLLADQAEAAKNKEKTDKYNAAMKSGDDLMASNKLAEAKIKYQDAQKIDASQTKPAENIAKIDKLIADQAEAAKNKEKTDKYNAAMKIADDLMASNKLAEAKVKYQDAQKIDASQTKPAENIAKIEKLLLDQAEAQKAKDKADKISALLKEGSTLFGKNDFENAKKKYQDVLTLDQTNSEATAKITEINAKIAANNSETEKAEKFKALKAKGLDLMKQEKWSDAKQTLLEAKSFQADTEIETKLKEIDKKIAEENAKLGADQAYNKVIDEAKILENSNIDGAIAKYKEAQKLKPNESLPATKIKELETKKLNNSAQAETDKKYADAIKKGDDFLSERKYKEAIESYNLAGSIKPSEKEPVDKAKIAQKKSEDEANDQARVQYNKIISAGQKAMDEKNWDKAKEMFNRAIKLDPTDNVPKDKLKEIDALIKAEEDAKKGNLDKENAYNTKLKEAEAAAKTKEYDKAISLFTDAKNLKPSETLPVKRISEIEELKIKEANNGQIEKIYTDFMTKGNSAFDKKEYTQALIEYKNALATKNNDKTALLKIEETIKLIDAESKNKEDQEFNALVKEGNTLYDSEKWLDAKNIYEKALSIKNDVEVKKKYDKCIKNEQEKGEFTKQYQNLIKKADEKFDVKNYEKAKELYERAITFNSSDSYPKDKLKEIEAILNPPVAVQVGPLPNLGVPTTEDIEKVNEALQAAQNTRKGKKEAKLKNKKDKIQDKNTETQEAKTEKLLGSKNELSTIEKENSLKYETGDENRQVTVDKVQTVDKTISTTTAESQNDKYNENLNNTEQVKNITSENSVLYAKADVGYTDNTESVIVYDKKIVNQSLNSEKTAYDENIQNQQSLGNTSKKIDEKVIDDFESRKIIEEQVKATNANINKVDDESIVNESSSILDLSVKLEGEEKVRLSKTTEDAKSAGNNDEKLKTVEQKITTSVLDQNTKAVDKSLNSDEILANKQTNINKLPAEQDENRTENVNEIQSGGHKIQDKSRDEFNSNVVKNLKKQDELSSTTVKNDIISVKEKTNSNEKIAAVDLIDKKSIIANTENSLSDDEQRQKTKESATNSQISITKESTKTALKVDENISGVQNVSNDITAQKNKEELAKKENLTNAQVLLNKISSKEIKYDEKVANDLGTLYPEGVSQEVFNQNDEDGLLVAVVTRRVVVKSGFGQIYIRTQSLSGLTFSKNGEASSEFVWQKETQDAKLKKNY